MRWSVIVMLSALAFSTALSQSRKKMYFDENDKPLPGADGCYYYSSIKKGKTSLGIDTLLTIYCESKLTRTIETINENGVRNGPYIKFNEQGEQIITGNFEAGKPVLLTQWYQKGRPKVLSVIKKRKSILNTIGTLSEINLLKMEVDIVTVH